MQQYFINESISENSNSIKIQDKELYRHLIKVLRMNIGENCLLVDNNQKSFVATLLDTNDNELEFSLVSDDNRIETEFEFSPIIACSLSKKDKIEWIAQKSTELGAKEVVFFSSQFSIMKWNENAITKKLERLQEIVKNAAQQSHRKLIPKVNYVHSIKELVNSYDVEHKLVAYEEVAKAGEPNSIVQNFDKIQPLQKVLCVFGPEGGLDANEVDFLIDNGYTKIGLGPRILRAETAPVYFLSTLSFKFELL